MFVQTGPSDPLREDEYNEWYSATHIPQVCEVPGITGARRFKALGDGGTPVYIAIYELDADDLADPMRELRARSASGEIERNDVLQLNPPPVVTIYELIE
jgi:hypothetical protein